MITNQEFAQRRQAVLDNMDVGDLAILPAAHEQYRNNDATYPFRQNSDFYYLTGFPEPEAIALLYKESADASFFVLFNRDKDLEHEIWSGPRVGQDAAISEYRADKAYSINELDQQMPEIISNVRRIYYTLGRCQALDKRLLKWINIVRAKVRTGVNAPRQFLDLDPLIHNLRLFKSADELKLMRTAAEISAQAHNAAMQAAKPGIYEYQLEAVLQQYFLNNACRAMAYEAIVAAGANACVLHYTANTAQIAADDLILIDAGAEYQTYAADITRTFPANGKFTTVQAEIYDLVLQSQLAGINEAKAGRPWNAMQNIIIKTLTEGLVALGILQGDVEELMAEKAYHQFYMHNSGHWLGMDVHDVGAYKTKIGKWRDLEPGMVLTVEPGLYIRPSESVPEHYWNIGVRIEDDVLITTGEPDILSKDVPKTRDDIIGLMQ